MSSLIQEVIALKENEAGVNHISCQTTGTNSGDSLVKKVQQTEEQELDARKDLPLTVMGSEIEPPGQDNPLEKDINCSHRKRPLWELTRSATESSSAMNQKVDLNNDSSCDGSANKKLKTENENSSPYRDTSGNDSGIMKKSPKIVFPLDLNAEREDMEMVDNFIPFGNNNNSKRQSSGTVPNLELALGAEETSEDTMGLLPFLGGSSNSGEQSSNSKNKEKQKADEEEDDDVAVAPSLSLSLSFPGEKRKNVNTPLFLFRDHPR